MNHADASTELQRSRPLADAVARIVQRSSIQVIDYDPRYLMGTMEIARQIHAHSIYADMPLDEMKLMRQLLTLPKEDGMQQRYFRLAVRGNEVLGGFYGCLLRVFFCDQLTAKDMGWWVKESSRGGAAAVLLLHDFERWARERGARKCMVGQSGVESIDRTLKLFRHCGYSLTGYNTSKDL